jgi:hypothetical protein
VDTVLPSNVLCETGLCSRNGLTACLLNRVVTGLVTTFKVPTTGETHKCHEDIIEFTDDKMTAISFHYLPCVSGNYSASGARFKCQATRSKCITLAMWSP